MPRKMRPPLNKPKDAAVNPPWPWLSKAQLATALGVSLRTVERGMENGEIPYYKIRRKLVRFSYAEVVAVLEKTVHHPPPSD